MGTWGLWSLCLTQRPPVSPTRSGGNDCGTDECSSHSSNRREIVPHDEQQRNLVRSEIVWSGQILSRVVHTQGKQDFSNRTIPHASPHAMTP